MITHCQNCHREHEVRNILCIGENPKNCEKCYAKTQADSRIKIKNYCPNCGYNLND